MFTTSQSRSVAGSLVVRAATALITLASLVAVTAGCGGSSAQRQQAMMLAAAQAQANQMPSGPDGYSGGLGDVDSYGPEVDEYSYRLAPGDLIDVKFPYHPEENERVPVRPDGRVSLQVAPDVAAAGLTVRELEERIVEKASHTLRDPIVSVVIAQLAEHKIYVGGSVLKPGFVNYQDGMTPLQAVIERGGFTDTAKADEVLYITRIGDEIQAQRLDLQSVVDGESIEETVLAPDDIVFVPTTWIGKANVWVDQWIRGLLPTVPRPGFDLNSVAF